MFPFRCYDVDGQRGYIVQLAVFYNPYVAIAHQYYFVTIYLDNAVYYVTTTLYPCQHDVPDLQIIRFDKVDALLATDDEWQHAVAFHGKGNAQSFVDQFDGTLDDFVIGYVVHALRIVLEQISAASWSGRHSRCHTFTSPAIMSSVSCNPSATCLSQRLPEIDGTKAA